MPDYADSLRSLSGALGHPQKQYAPVQYIGPLSRFAFDKDEQDANTKYAVVAILSGLEPQRTMLEKEIVARYQDTEEQVLIVQGLLGRPNTQIKRNNITVVPHMEDKEMARALLGAKHIIARSGYSTIMDLDTLGVLPKAELIPTPGQPEQEYLALLLRKK